MHTVVELLFPHMLVWCSGKNTEKSITAEEEGVPKVNIQVLLGFILGQVTSLIYGDQNGIRKRE